MIRNSLPRTSAGKRIQQPGNGIAHANIRARLQARDEHAGLKVTEEKEEYIACLQLPQAEAANGESNP